jgi:hypothetical protein
MADRMLVTALQYLNKYGWGVLPCGKDKTPVIGSWTEYQTRLPTEKEVRQWWKEHPGANVAIITGKISGLTVIDVDSDAGDEALWELLPEDFDTLRSRTPSGGVHYYCKYAEGTRNAARWITDCDIRSEGGYVIAPPSSGILGKWTWLGGPEDRIASVPDEVLRKLSRETQPGPAGPPPKGLAFSSGTRDENLFSVANSLLKGGMHEDDARKVLEILARNCDPPFSSKEVGRKVQSALNRQGRQKGEVVDLFREWIEGDTGLFFLKDAAFDLNITDRRGRQALSNAAARLAREGILKKTETKGRYRIVDTGTEVIDFMGASDEEIPLLWPLGINRYFRLLPKNVCVIAGEQDAGKTAYLLALAHMNMKEHEIHYFSSEMGPEEFKSRLKGFQPETKLSDWKKYDFFPHERDSNFADIIKPDAINIIDYLEIDGAEGREFWRVGGMLKDIRDRLNKGAAIVAIQKNPDKKDNHNLGLGGYRGLEKPRLYMSMGKHPNRLRLEKVKNWRNEEFNPNGLQVGFKLIRGCRFQINGEWHHINIGGE